MPRTTIETSMTVIEILVWAAPLICAIVIARWPLGGMTAVGLAFMYLGMILAAFLPLFGIVVSVGLAATGVLLVAINAALDTVVRAIEKSGPGSTKQTAEEQGDRSRDYRQRPDGRWEVRDGRRWQPSSDPEI